MVGTTLKDEEAMFSACGVEGFLLETTDLFGGIEDEKHNEQLFTTTIY